jgi:hypothetical protein
MLECFLGHDHNHEHNEKEVNVDDDHHHSHTHHHNLHEIVPKQSSDGEIPSPKTLVEVKINKKKKNFLKTIKSK